MNEYRSRPDFSNAKLDFSEFHPLDHSLRECKNYPGGRRTHLKYRWEFQTGPAVRAATFCKIGRHERGQFWQRDLTWIACIHCHKPFSERQPE